MKTNLPNLGLGIGWRSELALAIDRRKDLGFVEVLAEDMDVNNLPEPVRHWRDRGRPIIPHGVSLSLGSPEPPARGRLRRLAKLAERLKAPLVSEHIAFVRADGIETGHLLPMPKTREAIELLAENIRIAQDALPVPLALENVASLFGWPDDEMDEADFLSEIVERTGVDLLLDIENVYANARNHGWDPIRFLDRIPLERIAYVHVAGGVVRDDGFYHDTHAHAVPQEVLNLLEELCARVEVPGVMLERDDRFPDANGLGAELDNIAKAIERGKARRGCSCLTANG